MYVCIEAKLNTPLNEKPSCMVGGYAVKGQGSMRLLNVLTLFCCYVEWLNIIVMITQN